MNDVKKVLIVEDDSTLMVVVSMTLRRLGIAFDAAGSGEQALKFVRNHDYELILMDGKLPGITGSETTRQIRELEAALHRRSATVYGVTASDNEFDCLQAGMDRWFQKPAPYADIVKSFFAAREAVAS